MSVWMYYIFVTLLCHQYYPLETLETLQNDDFKTTKELQP